MKNAKPTKADSLKLSPAFIKTNVLKLRNFRRKKHADRHLIRNSKRPFLTAQELNAVYDLDYTREVYPFYARMGKVKAHDTIKFPITMHRGCAGKCNSCSIAAHQEKEAVSKSGTSIF